MKSLRVCFALTSVLLLGVQSVALAQSLPKYEIHELGYSGTSTTNSDTYVATVVDRAANMLWLCTLSFHIMLTGKWWVYRNECHVSAKGPVPNLATMTAAPENDDTWAAWPLFRHVLVVG